MFDYHKVDDFLSRSDEAIKSYTKENAYNIIIAEIDSCEDRYLNEYIVALNYFRYPKILYWIEINIHRINQVTLNWGHLAASSYFSWSKAKEWLSKGRPLSLIALDALIFCTSVDSRLNQSPWMQKINPRLVDDPSVKEMANYLNEFLKCDHTSRTENSVTKIIKNIFDSKY